MGETNPMFNSMGWLSVSNLLRLRIDAFVYNVPEDIVKAESDLRPIILTRDADR